jgi:hypothetical protein
MMTATIRSRFGIQALGRRIGGARMIALMVASTMAAGGLATTGIIALTPESASASSHREAPLISGEPQFDNTDVYAFVSPDKPDTTTLVANFIPMEEPGGGPNFYRFADEKSARYDMHVDSNGDGQGDLLFRWTFTDHQKNDSSFLYNGGKVTSLHDPDLNFIQTYDIEMIKLKQQKATSRTVIANDVPVAPSDVGKASMPDYQSLRDQAVKKLGKGMTAFAGQADDPFFADLRVFDLLYGGDMSEVGNDTLKGYNVNTFALQVPSSYLRQSKKQPVVGIWGTVNRKGADGNWEQVSRLGNPLVNEVVNPVKDKDKFNASSPQDDGQFLKNVTDPELPKLIESIYKIKAPKTPRKDLVQVFLTGVPKLNQPPKAKPGEELRLNTSIKPTAKPKRLGVLDGDKAGFPNGRRLSDDVIDISLQAVEGELVGTPNDLSDGVNANDRSFGKSFPYVGLPTAGSAGAKAKVQAQAQAQAATDGQNPLSSGVMSGGNMLLLGTAASGAAGVLLVGSGLLWWRRTARRPATAGRRARR